MCETICFGYSVTIPQKWGSALPLVHCHRYDVCAMGGISTAASLVVPTV